LPHNFRLVFDIFAALAEFEQERLRERTTARMQAARARGRKGGRKFGLAKAQSRPAQTAMKNRDTRVGELCKELGGITRATPIATSPPNVNCASMACGCWGHCHE
jgi:DNA invertase Pin-like site-specific DNA recombinase